MGHKGWSLTRTRHLAHGQCSQPGAQPGAPAGRRKLFLPVLYCTSRGPSHCGLENCASLSRLPVLCSLLPSIPQKKSTRAICRTRGVTSETEQQGLVLQATPFEIVIGLAGPKPRFGSRNQVICALKCWPPCREHCCAKAPLR